ncbi:ribonuclease H-like domain-containing protein [Tanacetum coccineum]
MVTVRCLISITVKMSWPLYQLDVNNVFLYGDLKQDVYMILPQRFDNDNGNKVYKLNKSLYDLKQAPRQWNAKLATAVVEHGFVQSKFDYSLYVNSEWSVFVALLVYVDDIVITENDESGIKDFKKFLITKVQIKDLGEQKYFLRIEVLKNDKGICMSQRKYCMDLLHEYGLLAARPVETPFPENTVLNFKESKKEKYLRNFTSFQQLIGKLRPVHCLSQRMHSL